MTPLTVHSRTVQVKNAAGELASTSTALADGTFCVHCKPGIYQFSVSNLVILPAVHCTMIVNLMCTLNDQLLSAL